MDAWFQRMMSMLRREVVMTMRAYHQPPRMGLVSSYNPQLHAVKVQFQPEGTESGWIPLTALATGNNFGILSAPNIKDQVEVQFQEGEHMVARVATRNFSSIDQAPQIQPGEHIVVHGLGAYLYFKQDGTVQLTGANVWPTGTTGGGQSGNASTGPNGETGQPVPQQQPTKPNAKQTFTLNPDGSMVVTTPQGPITVTANGNLQRSASGNISDTAAAIGHSGPTTVTGTLGVSQITTALAYNQSSDKRAKRKFAALKDVLRRALLIPFWKFDLYQAEMVGDEVVLSGEPRRTLGGVAQEVRELFPEIVSGDETKEILRLEEGKIGVIALAALQEYVKKTDSEIAALKSRITELESK